MPFSFIPAIAAGAGALSRQLVKYAWGPLVTGVGHLFKSRSGIFIFGIMAWLGINLTTMMLVIAPAIAMLEAMTSNISAEGSTNFAKVAGQYAGLMQIDRAVTMIISAVFTRHAMRKSLLFLQKVPGV